MVRSGAATPGSGAFSAANGIEAFPFMLQAPTTFYKGFWVNGSSAGNESAVALYDADYNLLVETNSTTGTGAAVPQAAAFLSTLTLPPGLYYCALAHETTTANRMGGWSVTTTGAAFWGMAGCWKQTGGITLPAAGNPAGFPNPATPTTFSAIRFTNFGAVTRTGFDL
jgi:hypothetical protein